MSRLLNYLRSLFPQKPDPELVDIRDASGEPVDMESSDNKVCIELTIEQAKIFMEHCEDMKWGIQNYKQQNLISKLSDTLHSKLSKFWYNMLTAPDSDDKNFKFVIMYANGSTCLGKCVKITQPNGSRGKFYVPASANFDESLELIKTGIQPTHWRRA